MDPNTMSYPEMLQRFYDEDVLITLVNDVQIRRRIDDIEDESDGWDTKMLAVDPPYMGDGALPITAVKRIELFSDLNHGS